MSLINDALKRAKQAQPQAPKPATGPALRPVEHCRRGEQSDFLMGALVAVILLMAALLLWVWSHSEINVIKVRARSIPAITQPSAKAALEAITFPQPVTSPKTNLSQPAPVGIKVASFTPLTASNVTPVIAKPVVPPITYKLQSIFYRPKNPSAAINGKTIFVGSFVNDARVASIAQDSVTLVLASGETKVLELP